MCVANCFSPSTRPHRPQAPGPFPPPQPQLRSSTPAADSRVERRKLQISAGTPGVMIGGALRAALDCEGEAGTLSSTSRCWSAAQSFATAASIMHRSIQSCNDFRGDDCSTPPSPLCFRNACRLCRAALGFSICHCGCLLSLIVGPHTSPCMGPMSLQALRGRAGCATAVVMIPLLPQSSYCWHYKHPLPAGASNATSCTKGHCAWCM